MGSARKGLVGALMVLALVLAGGLAVLGPWRGGASAAPGVGGGTPGPARATPGVDTQQVVNDVLARFAARLGVSQQTLNADFIAAVNDTIDQAVKDGKVSADEGAKIKQQAAQMGLAGVLAGGANNSASGQGDGGAKRVERDQFAQAAWDAALTQMTATLGITPEQLKQQLGQQRIADIAQAHNVDLAHLRAAMLAAAQAQLNGFVQAGQITQEQANTTYASLTTQIDGLLAQPAPQAGKGDRWQNNGPGDAALQAAWEAGAAKIGLSPVDLKKTMAGGKSMATVAGEHGLSVQDLRATMIAAGRASIDNAVKAGKVPPDQANTLYSELDTQVDKLINTAPASSATPASR